MGQAERNRQDVRYRDVELELWELDAEEEYGGRSRRGGRAGADNSARRAQGRNGGSMRRADNVNRRQRTDRQEYARGTERVRKSAMEGEARRGQSRVRPRNDGAYGESRGYRKDDRNRVARNRTYAGEPNIMLYEKRQARGRYGQTKTRHTEHELQIQDIRRYQRGETRRRAGTTNGHAKELRCAKRRRTRMFKVYLARMTAALLAVMCLVVIYYMVGEIYKMVHDIRERNDNMEKGVVKTISEEPVEEAGGVVAPDITKDYLEVNEFSRPGTKLGKINSIFVHYTANPGTSAAQNRSYFANLALTQERSASAHLIIGYDGEVIQCIPFDEQAYAVMTRNEDSISIECCFVSEDGSFTQETYDTLVHTLAWLTERFDLSTSDILRHYDCGGKKCPIYYVENESAWEQLLQDVEDYRSASQSAHK